MSIPFVTITESRFSAACLLASFLDRPIPARGIKSDSKTSYCLKDIKVTVFWVMRVCTVNGEAEMEGEKCMSIVGTEG